MAAVLLIALLVDRVVAALDLASPLQRIAVAWCVMWLLLSASRRLLTPAAAADQADR